MCCNSTCVMRRHGNKPLLARIYKPRGTGPFPLIIQVHGDKGWLDIDFTAGVGKILGMTITMEVGDIGRFADAGHFASYCRTVAAERTLIEMDFSRRKRAGKIDSAAAAFILQGVLDRLQTLGLDARSK